ncbi:unnamed protein product [Didymodactylos carnosus]|uniref:non-specific serine/threonine protein kinase n=1 Tax=Didymodactylos carnosus TaxID=1234261 RepID=A0A814ZKU8_9BILA|nr:unnamed protein product [Didymodactylos carnosus]CAF1245413.1 unnamed protein product [Didymodactylos carnosus]CAF3509313.1 unnamed protein product [Didymodactylos carnosus]CAF4011248.1 unnamed protein product [Didymodactylos carnosus]
MRKVRPQFPDLNHRLTLRHLPSIQPITKSTGRHLFLNSLNQTTNDRKKQLGKYGGLGGGIDSISKPRTITIVKHGEKPRKTISILLNRRTVQTFDQLLSDISEAFGYQKSRTDKLKKLFNLKGRQIHSIADFFREDDVFIASNQSDVSPNELQDIISELSLTDSSKVKQHLKQVQNLTTTSPVTAGLKQPQQSNDQVPPLTIDLKLKNGIRDSGFMDDEDLSGRDSDMASSLRMVKLNVYDTFKGTNTTTTKEPSEDTPNHDDLVRKLKKTTKSNQQSIELQREKDRQRLRDEEDKRKRSLALNLNSTTTPNVLGAAIRPNEKVAKFEPLTVDNLNNSINQTDDIKRSTKTKTPIGTFSPHFYLNAGSKASKHTTTQATVQTPKTSPQPPKTDNNEIQTQKKFIIKKRSLQIYQTPSVITDKYDLGKKMGDGNFAIVKRSKLKGTDKEYAIKIIDKSKMKGKEHMVDNEINIMYQCNHLNIIRLFEDYETPDEIYLVMELIKGGDLFDYITKHRRFDESTSSLMVKDVGEALLYLHSKHIVHRDLKPENLLVMQRRDGRIAIKLTDFGLAMEVNGLIKTVCGTPTYVAPEILAETGYGFEVDCWATGIITYILLCGYPPFKNMDRNQEELFQMIQRGKFTYDPDYWISISASAKNLIDHLLVVDRHKRMKAEEILLHPWIISQGQSKTLSPRGLEELRTTLKTKYEQKSKEYANENTT